jgi:hypothetical protein
MIRKPVLVAVTLGGLAAALATGCSDDTAGEATATSSSSSSGGGDGGAATTTTSTSSAGGAGGEAGGGGAGGYPPISCEVTPTTGLVLAVNKLYLGNTNPDDTPDKTNGWKQYGFNIDGLISTVASNDLCQPSNGAAPVTVYPDGDNGIDNSFGKNVLPILLSLDPAPQNEINASLQAGGPTLVAYLADLGPDPDQGPIDARVYWSEQTAAPPVFDGSDCYPIDPASLVDPSDIQSASARFDQSSLSGDMWTSGPPPATVVLTLSVDGYPLRLTIREARLSFNLSPGHDSAEGGQLGGVLDTEELVTSLRALIGTFQPSLCEGSTIEAILNQVRQAQDILSDGTQDPTQVCNAISIGLGFTMAPVSLGSVGPPVLVPPDPCAP